MTFHASAVAFCVLSALAPLVPVVSVVALLPACSKTAAVDDVYTALDGQGLRRRNRFTTDSKGVFCVVEYAASRPGVTLEVFIRQRELPNGNDTNRVLTAVEDSPSPTQGMQRAAIAFTAIDEKTGQPAQDGSPIPPGLFRCEVKLDGELAGVAEFRVDFADCPAAQIIDGTACKGFYKADQECPRYGASSSDKTSCKCSGDAWVCDK